MPAAFSEFILYAAGLAIVVHQVFRKYETYSVTVHLALLLVPPYMIAHRFCSLPGFPLTLLPAYGASTATYLSALTLSIVAYRLSPLHPLARYPGPVSHRISILVLAFQSTSGAHSKHIKALHERYGDVVRVGPNALSIVDPSVVPIIHGPSGIGKGPAFIGGSLSHRNLPMVGIQDTNEHIQRRRPWNRGLSSGALKDYEPIIVERVKQLIRRLEKQANTGSKTVLGKLLKYFSFDVMTDMAFGGGSELLRDGDQNNMWNVIDEGMMLATFFGTAPWLGVYVGHIPGAARPLQRLHARSRAMAAERLKNGTKTRDLFHYLNNDDLPDRPPPPARQLANDAVLAVVAGSDTTFAALTSLFFCIATHPEAYARLQEEVDRFYPVGESPYNTAPHREMHYLQAVINETLRLLPPVAQGSPREVPPDGGPFIAGSLEIPPGTQVEMPGWTLQRDARNFTCPLAFWPERWLIASGKLHQRHARRPSARARRAGTGHMGDARSAPGDADEDAFVHNDVAWVAFSHGPLNCVGKGLAMLEMRMLVCAVLQRFRVRLEDGWDLDRYEDGIKDYFTTQLPEYRATIERRV